MRKIILMFCLMALSATPVFAAIKTETFAYDIEGKKFHGYIAYDDEAKRKRPGVLIVHEWWGQNEYVRKRAHMLAEAGYVALALDMYGDGKIAANPDEASKLSKEVMDNINTEGMKRFLVAYDILKKFPWTDHKRIAAIGYCFGGGVALHMARVGFDLDGVVSFHGNLAPVTPAQRSVTSAKILVLNGADDSFITKEAIDNFKREMKLADVDYTFKNYKGAKHAFTNPDADKYAQEFNLPIAYNKEADEASWKEMLNFFKKIF